MLSLKDLLDEGLLSVGESLIWHKLNSGLPYEATILADGRIQTADGKTHNSPSMAARHVNGGVSTNGWRVWRALDKNVALSEIRATSASHENSEERGLLHAPKSEL